MTKTFVRIFVFTCLMAPTITATAQNRFNILDFGEPTSGKATRIIQAAVDQCHASGGGVVVVPAGVYTTGTIELKSNVELYLSPGAVLRGSTDLDDYKTSFRRHGILFCENAENVSISGRGKIDARAPAFHDSTKNHLFKDFDRSFTRQKNDYLKAGTFFSDGPIGKLPKAGMPIAFYHCTRVSIRDILLVDAPSWAIRLAYCEDVVVDGITIRNNLLIPNSDGIHCTVSRNVRITNCDISAGDDAIAITGFTMDEMVPGYTGEEQARFRFGNKEIYSEHITVSACHLQSRSAAIRVGYGQHPIRRCIFSDLQIYGSNRGIGIFSRDAAPISELQFSNITIETRLHNGQWWGNGEPIHISTIPRFKDATAGIVSDIRFTDVSATAEHGIVLWGSAQSRLKNISFERVSLGINKGKETLTYGGNFDLMPNIYADRQVFQHDVPAMHAQYIDGLFVNRFSVTWGTDLPAFFTHLIDAENCTGVCLSAVSAFPSDGSRGQLQLKDVDRRCP